LNIPDRACPFAQPLPAGAKEAIARKIGQAAASGRGYRQGRQPLEVSPMTTLHSIKPAARQSLRAMLAAAYRADPCDQLIAPVGNDNYSTVFSLIPVALAVLRVAAQIEPDPAEVMQWYRSTRIGELGHLTATELVALGRAEAVIHFLQSIRAGQRD
jgi:hypothetical protein